MASTSASRAWWRIRRTGAALAAASLLAPITVAVAAPPAGAAANQPLSIVMSSSLNPVPSGGQLTYTIDVTNTGGARVDGVTLTDQINGMTGLILTSSVGSCGQSANLVTCSAGTMIGGQAWRVTIRGTATAASGTTLNNTAAVTGNKSSTTFTTSTTASVLVSNAPSVNLPDLTIAVTGPSKVAPGGTLTYNLTINNIGSVNAAGVLVKNTLPPGFAVVTPSLADPTPVRSSSLFSCDNGPTTVTCSGGAVNAGANATISIDAVADPGPSSAYTDTAVVDPYDAIPEGNELNNTGAWTLNTNPPAAQTGLTISLSGGPDPVRPGDVETYNIHVANTATTRADSISIVDGTQGLDAASITATTTKGVCTVNAPKVTCTQLNPVLRLDPGQSLDITIRGTVVATAGSLLLDTATVTGNIKNKAVKNTASTTTTVRPGVDLTTTIRAEQTHGDPPGSPAYRAWDDFNYVINVGNSGLNDAVGAVVRLPLAPGVTYLGSSGPATCGADPNQVVTCTLTVQGATSSNQPGGAVQEFRVHVVSTPTPGTIGATVTVDPGNAIYESDETNNVASTTTAIDTGIDLTIMKDSEPVVAPSGTLVYTITVWNIGTQDSAGVVFRDTLPAGTRFRSASASPAGDHNFTCASDGATTGGIVTCSGGNLRGTHDHGLPADFATLTIVVFAPAAPGLITNQVLVDPANAIAEIDETNNVNTKITDIEIGGCCAFNELTITQTQLSPVGNVAPSGLLDYEVTVGNVGTDPAFNVAMRDFLPAGSIFRYAQDEDPLNGQFFTCTQASGVVDCVGATLGGTIQAPGGTTRKVKIGVFAPAQPGTYINQAIVDPANTIPEGDETNNTANQTTTVALGGGGDYIDLAVDSAQSSPVGAVVPNGILQYTLTPKNLGTAVAFNVAVRATLPSGAVFRSAYDDSGIPAGAFTCSASGNVVDCVGGTLDGSDGNTPAVGDTQRTIRINVFAPGHVGGYTEQSSIDPANAIAETDETNNTSQAGTTVSLSGAGGYVDLDITNPATSVAEPSPGQQFQYSFDIENLGTDMVNNVEVKNALPPGVSFVNATATQGFLCGQSSGVVDCTGGTLDGTSDQDPANTPTATVTITVTAPLVADQQLTDQILADPANAIAEANEGNNSATIGVHVKAHVDLTATNSASGLSSGSTGEWDWSVTATGSDGATGVVVETDLPTGVIIEGYTAPAGWSCQQFQNPVNQVVCTGDLAAGGTASFSASVFVTAPSGSTLNSTTIVDPDNTVVETDETNNTAQASTSA